MDVIQKNREAFFDKLLSGELDLDKWLNRASDKAIQQLVEYNRRKEKENKERETVNFFRSGGVLVDGLEEHTETLMDGSLNVTEIKTNELKYL